MSKTLTLDTKNIYQLGLFLIGVISLILVGLASVQALKLLEKPKLDPAVKIREQQLNNAVDLTFPKKE